MNILVKIISFLSLLLISCNVDSSNDKRIQGDAFGTTYQVIVQSELSSIEIKEFSFLYLILKNLDLFKSNYHVIENVKLFTKENRMIFDELLIKIKSRENFNLDDLSIDRQLIDRIFKFASIKHIVDSENHEKILSLLDEIIRDLKNYELELRIEELESKFSKDLSESTFNEIRELKKLQKIN